MVRALDETSPVASFGNSLGAPDLKGPHDAPAASAGAGDVATRDHGVRADGVESSSPGAGARDVARFVANYERAHPLPWGAKGLAKWAFAHPGAVRATQKTVAGLSALAYALGSLPATPWGWLVNAFGVAAGGARATQSKGGLQTACLMGGVLPVAVSSVLGGPIAGVATGVGSTLGAVLLGGSLFEKLMATPGYDTASYPYLDRKYSAGELYHLPDLRGGRPIPVLKLDAARPLSAGFAHGYLLGPQIRLVLDSVRHELCRMPDYATLYPHAVAQLRQMLTQDEVRELQGMVLGFNERAREDEQAHRLTFEELLSMQVLPDLCHFQWQKVQERATGARAAAAPGKPPTAGCTSVMLRGADGKVTWGRNMDWAAFGMCGAVSLPIVWTHAGAGHDYAVLGIPGMIGAVTGWNDAGLSLAMNVVGGHTRRVAGVPAGLYNRRLLRQAASVDEVMGRIADPQHQPLGPYHLTVADATQGRCISFYQAADKSHHARVLADKPLWCLNWSYPGKRWDVFPSAERHADLKAYFKSSETLGPVASENPAALVEGALRLGSTNNLITLHTLVFCGDRVSMRWSNAFAAAGTPVEIRRDAIFSQGS